jgi:hypothetical protein
MFLCTWVVVTVFATVLSDGFTPSVPCRRSSPALTTIWSPGKARLWWESFSNKAPCETLDQLIIILDEVGKNPDFALGLVDEVRNILITIQNRGLAKSTMLVLVGSGLDGFIADSSSDLPIVTRENCQESFALQSFGTDPSKSDVIIIHGPTLDDRVIQGVKLDDIMRGTYSHVLATNTRMLFHGVIPIMTDEKHTISVEDLSSRSKLGSTNIVMDYAARIYIRLNGMKRLEKGNDGSLERLLLKQFLLIQQDFIRNSTKNWFRRILLFRFAKAGGWSGKNIGREGTNSGQSFGFFLFQGSVSDMGVSLGHGK